MRTILVFGLIWLCGAAAQEQATFKSGVTMIQVPVVVRDRDGHSVPDLTKDDFQLFDNGKQVEIAGFSVDKPGSRAIPDRSLPDPASSAKPAAAMDVPERFIAYFFDDISLGGIGILQHIREAAAKQINELQPGDRVAIVTSSCSLTQDFTNDRAKLVETIARLQVDPPRVCRVSRVQVAQIEVLKNVVKAMANLPGRHEILLISAGFFLLGSDPSNQTPGLIDAAVHAKVVINALDTGGATEAAGTRSMGATNRNAADGGMDPNGANANALNSLSTMLPLVLVDLAHGTGGTYVTGNDFGVNFRKLSTPESYYVLSFVSAAKADGKLHQLKVKLEKKGKFTVDARSGYYAAERAE
jgi:VWFA-related protein